MRYEIGPCPACDNADAALIAARDDIRDELEQLWSFHTHRIRGETPVGRLHDRIAFSQDPPLGIVRCTACGLLYRNPRERLDELLAIYGGEEPEDAALQTLFENQRDAYMTQVQRLTRIVDGGARIGLEVGSYVGAFLAGARDMGWTFSGLDVNDAANEFARGMGFDVTCGTIEERDPKAQYDVIAFWNCFDQLPDPRGAAAAARQRVRDGGWIAVRVPSGAFYARWRARLHGPLRSVARALLAHNNLLGFPYRHGFSAASLRTLLERTGFCVAHVFGDTLVPIADRWTRPWARLEERVLKTALRPLPAAHAPWLEVYAQAR